MATELVRKETVLGFPKDSCCPYALRGKIPTQFAVNIINSQAINFNFVRHFS